MDSEKLNKHFIEFDIFLKRAKKEFEARLQSDLQCLAAINDFYIIKTLGTGSFGRVVLVREKRRDEKSYAMKIMEKVHVVRTKQIQHTIYEIRILDAVKFDFIINLEYFFKDNVYLYLVMPFIGGGEMFTHLRHMKRFDETLAKFYGGQVVLAFEYMHFLGLVYRDLKPENILIECDGYIKIADLGFCKKIDDQRTYTLCGTPEYLAPEVILSQGYNRSVDYWSFGILLFEMSAGFPPFYAKDPMRIYEKIIAGKYVPPPHFSRALKDLIANILQIDRTKRFGILKNGTKDIKGHEWFRNLDWDLLLNKRIKPMFKPQLVSEGDTSNFDYYEETPLRQSSKDEFAKEFTSIRIK